jgi:hypothetical protein
MNRVIVSLVVCLTLSPVLFAPCVAEAGLLYHAAKRSTAQSIFKGGFKKSLMNRKARFGPGVYLSKTRKTALSEKPSAQSVLSFNKGKGFDRKVLDTRGMSSEQFKRKFGVKDMRGAVKKGVVGPKLAHRIGDFAGRHRKIVSYRSARDPKGTNYITPSAVYSPRSRLIATARINSVSY